MGRGEEPGEPAQTQRVVRGGISFRLRALVVCHCFRMNDALVRIISARKANKKEEITGTGGKTMRKHYDFGKMKGERNPYVKVLKQPITMRLDKGTVAYFKALATELGMPYQNLINLYLRECALNHKKLELKWAS